MLLILLLTLLLRPLRLLLRPLTLTNEAKAYCNRKWHPRHLFDPIRALRKYRSQHDTCSNEERHLVGEQWNEVLPDRAADRAVSREQVLFHIIGRVNPA